MSEGGKRNERIGNVYNISDRYIVFSASILMRNIELVPTSERPEFKLGYQVISQVLVEFNFWTLPLV